MGKFDGYLILSDIDGTLTHRFNKVSNENILKIEYFKSQGGLFSIATGRLYDFFIENELDKLVNCPAVILNGAAIYDFKKKEIVFEKNLCDDYTKVLDFLRKKNNLTAVTMCMTNGSIRSKTKADFDILYTAENPCKIVAVFDENDEQNAIKLSNELQEKFGDIFDVYRSWATGVEVISKNSDKGSALLRLKKELNATTSIGIGDFENDYTLLKCADISAAPSNACDKIKNIADIITQPNSNNAIADLINKLENVIH